MKILISLSNSRNKSISAKQRKFPSYNFKKINYSEFERIRNSSEDYTETEVDGKGVIAAMNGDNCVVVYYKSKKFGSMCPAFKGDVISYTESDSNWPYDN